MAGNAVQQQTKITACLVVVVVEGGGEEEDVPRHIPMCVPTTSNFTS